jgi:predicted O-methyltransferase YrrM
MNDIGHVAALFADSEQNFKKLLAQYVGECRWFLGRTYNGYFDSVDAEVYYSIVRSFRPKLIIEIGSGNSTFFCAEAIKANGSGRIISIDPEPRMALPSHVEHMVSRVEDLDPVLFGSLSTNDILFIDSSHTTEEALFHTREILPHLGVGVIVHHHDVLFPYVRYHMGDPQTFGEPDVILDYYMHHQDQYRVLLSTSYVHYRDPELMARLIRSYRWLRARVPGSVWTVRIA